MSVGRSRFHSNTHKRRSIAELCHVAERVGKKKAQKKKSRKPISARTFVQCNAKALGARVVD